MKTKDLSKKLKFEIKKEYIAPSIQEATLKAKLDLGEKAVILDQKTVTKHNLISKVFGTKPRQMAKVTAVIIPDEELERIQREVDERKRKKENSSRIQTPQNFSPQVPERIIRNIPNGEIPYANYGGPVEDTSSIKPVIPAETIPEKVQPSDSTEKMLMFLTEEMLKMREELKDIKSTATLTEETNYSPKTKLHPNIEKMKNILEKNEVESRIIDEILDHLANLTTGTIENWEKLNENVILKLSSMMNVGGPIDLGFDDYNGPQVFAFVGATGVGKTTTIAKLAADFTLKRKKKVALITLDTFRVAAMEQLKVYAEIIGIPVKVIFKTEEIKTALDEFRDKDLILIDTAGRSQQSRIEMIELKSYFEDFVSINTFLVVSSSTRYSDMTSIVSKFSDVGVNKLVLTKTDETTTFGPIVNLSVFSGKPVAYITNGQSVPDDIKIAEPVELIRRLVENV